MHIPHNALVDAVMLLAGEINLKEVPTVASTLERYWSMKVWREAIRQAQVLVDNGKKSKDLKPLSPRFGLRFKYFSHPESDCRFAILASTADDRDEDFWQQVCEIEPEEFKPEELRLAQMKAIEAEIEFSGL